MIARLLRWHYRRQLRRDLTAMRAHLGLQPGDFLTDVDQVDIDHARLTKRERDQQGAGRVDTIVTLLAALVIGGVWVALIEGWFFH